jgi:tripartite-type tricarboxylate transporter receptor subunit TctC
MACALPSWGQSAGSTFPKQTVTLLVPFSTGTSADVMARSLGAKLSDRWGVPVVTDNRVGASGAIGTEVAAKATANGYTLLFTATSHGTVPALRPRLPYDPIKSFEPVILVASSALGLVIAPQLKMGSFNEWLAQLKAKPGAFNYASPGNGVVQHLAMALLLQETGTTMTHVPFKGMSGAMTDLMGGHVHASVVALQTSAPLILSGQLNMLAVFSEERSPAFAKVPTFKELGYPNLVVDTWYGIFAPAGTPPEVVTKLNQDLNAVLQFAEIREAMIKHGLSPMGGKPERLGQLLGREVSRWKSLIHQGQIQPD